MHFLFCFVFYSSLHQLKCDCCYYLCSLFIFYFPSLDPIWKRRLALLPHTTAYICIEPCVTFPNLAINVIYLLLREFIYQTLVEHSTVWKGTGLPLGVWQSSEKSKQALWNKCHHKHNVSAGGEIRETLWPRSGGEGNDFSVLLILQ